MRSRVEKLTHDDKFYVWKENWETVLFFFSLADQWQVAAGLEIKYLGIDHTSILSTMTLMETPKRKRKQLFLDIKIMVAAALEVLNKPKE